TGLPFVFAEWVIRSNVPPGQAEDFVQMLTTATVTGTNLVDEISRARTTDYMSKDDVANYVRNFVYFLGARERSGQQEFKRRLGKLPVWRPQVPTGRNYGTAPAS
ncbi:MAG: hypothetical protein O3B95_11180, partial [Chloroflexi bacterium]|nr:hypothetical protein [Chloroflexota bacterium]